MNLAPLLDAPFAVQLHVATVLPAALLGPAIFIGRKGTPAHRLLGKVWLILMVVSALSSFFIHSVNLVYGFSPIHLLSLFVLYGSYRAIAEARARRISAHRQWVAGLYLGGIVGAGLFTLLPGRIMNAVVLDRMESLQSIDIGRLMALAVVLALFGLASVIALRSRPRKI